MSCWNGLGVNYKCSNLAIIAEDIAYFNSIGLHYIRPHIPQYNDSEGTISTWRTVAKIFHDAGFYVQYGISASNITSANWNTIATAIKAEALICQNQAICDEFGLANELEGKQDGSMTDAQLRGNLRTLATETQPIYTIGPVSYQVSQGYQSGWISDATLGDLDLLGVNVYAVWTNNRYINRYYAQAIPSIISAFGNKIYLSEFNLDSDNTRFQAIPEELAQNEMRIMQKYIKDSGITRAQLYQWRGWQNNSNSDFNLKMINGDFKLAWNALANNNGRQWFINN